MKSIYFVLLGFTLLFTATHISSKQENSARVKGVLTILACCSLAASFLCMVLGV